MRRCVQVLEAHYELTYRYEHTGHMDELYVVRHEPTWREEPDDEYDSGTDHKTVYALFGLAIYKANCLVS